MNFLFLDSEDAVELFQMAIFQYDDPSTTTTLRPLLRFSNLERLRMKSSFWEMLKWRNLFFPENNPDYYSEFRITERHTNLNCSLDCTNQPWQWALKPVNSTVLTGFVTFRSSTFWCWTQTCSKFILWDQNFQKIFNLPTSEIQNLNSIKIIFKKVTQSHDRCIRHGCPHLPVHWLMKSNYLFRKIAWWFCFNGSAIMKL